MKPEERTCFVCAHIMLDYEADWSDITPGAGFTMQCGKGFFYFGQSDLYGGSIPWHEAVTKARTCPEFVERPEKVKHKR